MLVMTHGEPTTKLAWLKAGESSRQLAWAWLLWSSARFGLRASEENESRLRFGGRLLLGVQKRRSGSTKQEGYHCPERKIARQAVQSNCLERNIARQTVQSKKDTTAQNTKLQGRQYKQERFHCPERKIARQAVQSKKDTTAQDAKLQGRQYKVTA
jgi:hypothetical protein